MAYQKISQGTAEEEFKTLEFVAGPADNPFVCRQFPTTGEMIRVLATFFSQPLVWSTSVVELLTVVGLFSLIGGLYRHWECHVRGCHWPGHAVHGTSHRACWKHHPHLHANLTAEDIAKAAQEGQGGPA
jgi:hypothetical protein